MREEVQAPTKLIPRFSLLVKERLIGTETMFVTLLAKKYKTNQRSYKIASLRGGQNLTPKPLNTHLTLSYTLFWSTETTSVNLELKNIYSALLIREEP